MEVKTVNLRFMAKWVASKAWSYLCQGAVNTPEEAVDAACEEAPYHLYEWTNKSGLQARASVLNQLAKTDGTDLRYNLYLVSLALDYVSLDITGWQPAIVEVELEELPPQPGFVERLVNRVNQALVLTHARLHT